MKLFILKTRVIKESDYKNGTISATATETEKDDATHAVLHIRVWSNSYRTEIIPVGMIKNRKRNIDPIWIKDLVMQQFKPKQA